MANNPIIKLHPVVSSNVAAAGYDSTTQTLEIKFVNGAIYRYENVPKETYEAMWQAESVGKYVRTHIVKNFSFKKKK